MLIGRKPTGTLVQPSLLPGKRLYMLSTGTGIAPFSSIIKDPEVYDLYDKLILIHGCRQVAELQYGLDIVDAAKANEFFGEIVQEKLIHYPTVTREPYEHQGRITDLMESGKLFADIGQPPLNPADDRVMLCGSPGMLKDLVAHAGATRFPRGLQRRSRFLCDRKGFRRELKIGPRELTNMSAPRQGRVRARLRPPGVSESGAPWHAPRKPENVPVRRRRGPRRNGRGT